MSRSDTSPNRLDVWGASLLNKLEGGARRRRKREASKKRRDILKQTDTFEWNPASKLKVQRILNTDIEGLSPEHKEAFEGVRIPLRKIPVVDTCETVFAVADLGEGIVYYDDIEDGWEVGQLDESGNLQQRGASQFELFHILNRLPWKLKEIDRES